jgi:hypothetical protein
MTVKELKAAIEALPDDALVVIEGRWGETFEVKSATLETLLEYEQQVLYLN